jgi:hypothetical protein
MTEDRLEIIQDHLEMVEDQLEMVEDHFEMVEDIGLDCFCMGHSGFS